LGGGIIGGIPLPPNAKHDAYLSSSHPSSSLPKPMQPCPSSSNSRHTLPFVVFVAASSPPSYCGWLLCVGHMGLDIMDIIIASWIIIVIIIVSPSSPAEEGRAERCEGGRGLGGDCLGVNTAPSLCCRRACKASYGMFSWLSLLTTSLKTVNFCKNGQSYKKNQNWRSSVKVQLNSMYTANCQLMN
jgi:hypothetical protein